MQLLLLQLKAEGLPQPELEYMFHHTRRWRFDAAFPWREILHAGERWHRPIAVEIDGAVWTQGRHTRGSGYVKDMEKLNAAAELGWFVFRFSPQMVESGEAIRQLKRILK